MNREGKLRFKDVKPILSIIKETRFLFLIIETRFWFLKIVLEFSNLSATLFSVFETASESLNNVLYQYKDKPSWWWIAPKHSKSHQLYLLEITKNKYILVIFKNQKELLQANK